MLRPFQGLEICGDLLFGLQATDVSLGLIVGKGHVLFEGKGKPFVLVLDQAIEQVASFRVFGLASLALLGGRLLPVGQMTDMLELAHPGLAVGYRHCSLLADLIEFQDESVHLGSPF